MPQNADREYSIIPDFFLFSYVEICGESEPDNYGVLCRNGKILTHHAVPYFFGRGIGSYSISVHREYNSDRMAGYQRPENLRGVPSAGELNETWTVPRAVYPPRHSMPALLIACAPDRVPKCSVRVRTRPPPRYHLLG